MYAKFVKQSMQQPFVPYLDAFPRRSGLFAAL
jgi:hypothetical protein